MTKEDLLKMKLHEEKKVASDLYVRRVFGGWIYTHFIWNMSEDTPMTVSQCFVPESLLVIETSSLTSSEDFMDGGG